MAPPPSQFAVVIHLLLMTTFIVSPSFAVDDNPYMDKKPTSQNNPGVTAENEAVSMSAADQEKLLQRLKQVEENAARALEENKALKAQISSHETAAAATTEEKTAAMEERLEMLEEANFERIQEEEYALKIYGFADVQWYKFFYKDNTKFDGYLNDNNTFGVGHWNLYLEKRLSESFRFLGEVRFLFQPYGEETSFDADGTMFGGTVTTYERANTRATDWVDAYYFDWGGISIQRLWVEYKYSDMFGVRVGNFLTPYGLWNVDHGSTVVIPAHRPFLITAQLLPESQTGLDFFGRFFPSDTTSIDYALTVTNGRGKTAKLYDLDENKAVGLNLGFSYDGPVRLSLGTYLFLGEFTEVSKGYVVDPLTYVTEYQTNITENYIEKTMSFNLKLEWEGLLLQGEYVRGLIRYKDNGRLIVIAESEYGPAYYLTDYVQHAGYGLMAYRLPFDAVNLRPYFIYEYQKPSDASGLPQGHNFGGGLNWQITPAVVWKAEVFFHRENTSREGFDKWQLHYGVVTSQLAVSY